MREGGARRPTPDGKGESSYADGPTTTAPMPPVGDHGDPRLCGTTPEPDLVDKAVGTIKDVVQPG